MLLDLSPAARGPRGLGHGGRRRPDGGAAGGAGPDRRPLGPGRAAPGPRGLRATLGHAPGPPLAGLHHPLGRPAGSAGGVADGVRSAGSSTGAISSGPSGRGSFTAVPTGHSRSRAGGHGTSSGRRAAGSVTWGSSQRASAAGSRITGIRSWIGASSALAWVTRIVADSSTWPSRSQRSHSPAKANG